MNVGVMYGNPETTPGGKALKFYSDMRIRVQGKSKVKMKENGEDVVIGQNSSVTFVKNRVGRPFGRAEFKIMFDPNALNPVVMLANAARAAKLIRPYKGVLRIAKGVLEDNSVDTGMTTMVDLATYMVKNDLVLPILEKLEEAVDEDPTLDAIDGAILEMKDDPEKIVAPTTDEPTMETTKVEDADASELGDEIKEEAPEEV
jgi:RecA/RadA recombinase